MDNMTIQPALVQTLPVRSKAAAVLPKAQAPTLPVPTNHEEVNAQLNAIGQKRYDAVQQKAEAIANANVLGTTSFAIFKDAKGVLITRFFDKTTGKANYIPEPQMLKLGGGAAPAVLNIKA